MEMEATQEELDKIEELKLLLKGKHWPKSSTEYLLNKACINEPTRQSIVKYATDQDLLLRFIRGRKMNQQKALESITHYVEVRINRYPELFPDEVPEFVLHVIRQGIITVLRKQDSLGRTVVLFRASNWDTTKISQEEIICAGRYLIDELMSIPNFLTKGVILLTDCNGSTLSHARQFTVSNIVKFVNVFWQAYPIQIKGLYHVNAPLFIRPVYAIVKPFLPAKLRDRVLITSGVSELYKRIEPKVLPDFLGGILSDEEAITKSLDSINGRWEGLELEY